MESVSEIRFSDNKQSHPGILNAFMLLSLRPDLPPSA